MEEQKNKNSYDNITIKQVLKEQGAFLATELAVDAALVKTLKTVGTKLLKIPAFSLPSAILLSGGAALISYGSGCIAENGMRKRYLSKKEEAEDDADNN